MGGLGRPALGWGKSAIALNCLYSKIGSGNGR